MNPKAKKIRIIKTGKRYKIIVSFGFLYGWRELDQDFTNLKDAKTKAELILQEVKDESEAKVVYEREI